MSAAQGWGSGSGVGYRLHNMSGIPQYPFAASGIMASLDHIHRQKAETVVAGDREFTPTCLLLVVENILSRKAPGRLNRLGSLVRRRAQRASSLWHTWVSLRCTRTSSSRANGLAD